MRIRRTAGAAALAGMLMVAGGCGDASTTNGSGDEGGFGDDGPTATVTFDIEGEETLKGEATEPVLPTVNGRNPESCAEYAKGSTKESGQTMWGAAASRTSRSIKASRTRRNS